MPRTTKPLPTSLTSITNINPFDPENVNKRLYMQVSALLGQLEDRASHNKVTMRERIAALIAIGRIQQLFIAMRKASGDVGSGATVKKYATAFTTNATGGRAKNARRDAKRDIAASEPEPEDWFESADNDSDDDIA